jgi:cytoskeletal protein CcmA (bactofilin family)
VFRKRRGPSDSQGYNRISRLIEDRQRELEDDDGEPPEDDTIHMQSPAEAGTVPAVEDDEETVSLLDVRGSRSLDEPSDQEHETASYSAVSSSAEPEPVTVERDEDDFLRPRSDYSRDYTAAAAAPSISPAQQEMPVPDLGRAGASGSLVAAEATWEGKLRSDGDIRVEGTLRGEVETSATLIVAPRAQIHGTVRARSIMLAGDLEGDVTCEERLEILPGGSARGQINSGTLVVHEGAYLDSRFQMRREQPPAGS